MATEAELQAQLDTLTKANTELAGKVTAYEALKKDHDTVQDSLARTQNELEIHKKRVTELEPLTQQVSGFEAEKKRLAEASETHSKKYLSVLTKHLTDAYGVDPKAVDNKTSDQLEAILQALPSKPTNLQHNSAPGQGLGGNAGGTTIKPLTAMEAAQKDLEKLGVK